MRPDDHHVEPLFAGLGHRHGEETKPAGPEVGEGGGRPKDPTVKWKVLAVVLALAGLAWLLSHQAF